MTDTTTTFIGDIKFKDGETERLVSDLATIDEVNDVLTNYITKADGDNKYAMKGEISNVDLSGYYNKTECDGKYATSSQLNSKVPYTTKKATTTGSDVSSKIVGANTIGLCETTISDPSSPIDSGCVMGYSSNGANRGVYVATGSGQNNYYIGRITDGIIVWSKISTLMTESPSLTITNQQTTGQTLLSLLQPNLEYGISRTARMVIGRSDAKDQGLEIKYYSTKYSDGTMEPWASIGFVDTGYGITFNKKKVWIDNNVKIDGDLEVTGTITQNASMTITHHAPTEGDINDFIIGHPVFMSGKVFKKVNDEWQPSTPTDTTDCICSCMTTGTSKTYAGIITSIDAKHNSIIFATHGDYMFKVDDSSRYSVGDVLAYDGSIVDEDTTMTLSMQRSIIGQVSAIIDGTTLAIFKA